MGADKEVWKWKQRLGRLKTKIQGMVISKSQTKQRNVFPWGLRGLPAQPCVHILCICSVCVCTCVCMCEEKESHVLGHLACVEVRGQPQGLVLAFQRLLSLFTVYVRVAGIGPSMVSLLFIPISHRSTEIQTDVGVLGIQTSSHIFVASALPTEPHHQPHKMCCLCKWETQTWKTRREKKGGDSKDVHKGP